MSSHAINSQFKPTQPLRILQIVRSPEGGIRRHIVSITEDLIRRGHQVTICTSLQSADRSFDEFIKKMGDQVDVIDIRLKSAPGPWDLLHLFQLWKHLRHKQRQNPTANGSTFFDILHGHGAKGGLLARLLGLAFTASVVYTPHGGSLHSMHGWKNIIYSWIEKSLIRLTDVFLFESKYSKRQFFKLVLKETDPGTIDNDNDNAWPYVVNTNGISSDPQRLQKIKEWPVDLGRRLPLQIGAFGLLRKIKGFHTLIQAAWLLKKNGYQFQLRIFGEGEERIHLEQLISQLQLQDNVHLAGETTQALTQMESCHVICQPSMFESFGFVALEALSLGKAVVASRVGGLVEVVQDQKTGLLIPPEDPNALATALIALLDNTNLCLEIRKQGFQSAQTYFSESKMLDTLHLTYQKLRRASESC